VRISQREARRLRKRVEELERAEDSRRRRWSSEWPSGTHIATAKWDADARVPVSIRTARALRHAVIATTKDDGTVLFYALPLPGDL
jgi:hypothetical protein